MPPEAWDYALFGLHLRSALKLPELLPADSGGPPDVRVSIGKVPLAPDCGPGLHPIDGGLLLIIAKVARYFINDGAQIIVEPEPGVPEANIRLFLLGSAMGALIHQRGLLPLHANAVEIGGKAFAFTGRSGAGKSTLAAWFLDQGFPIIADDVCVVRFDDERQPTVSAGVPRLRLWREALDASGREIASFERSYSGNKAVDKYDVPIAHDRVAAVCPLGAIYLLAEGAELSITRLTGVDALRAVFENVYRGSFVALLKGERTLWQACVGLAGNTPIYRVERRWGLDDLAAQYADVLDHAREVLTRP